MARFPGALGLRAARAAEVAEGRAGDARAVAKPGATAGRPQRQPAVASARPTAGSTSAACPKDLPGNVTPIKDRYAGVLVYRDGETRARCLFDSKVAPPLPPVPVLVAHEAPRRGLVFRLDVLSDRPVVPPRAKLRPHRPNRPKVRLIAKIPEPGRSPA